MSVKEPGSFRLIATLALAGLISGLALAGVYLWARPLIEANEAAALRRAILELLPGTTEIVALTPRGERLVSFDETDPESKDLPRIYLGRNAEGKALGFAIPAEGPGFMDTIGVIYGYEPEKKVIVGMIVLESRETPGLGDRIAFDPHFLENFRALAVEPEIVSVKKGEKKNPNEVDSITGATISSKAVVSILNKGTARWRDLLDGEIEIAEESP